jgi:hypothetical protein
LTDRQRKREEWAWIRHHEPELARLLLGLEAAGLKAQRLVWTEGGPWAEAKVAMSAPESAPERRNGTNPAPRKRQLKRARGR